MKKHPGTAGSMPVKGTGCGIRPDLDEIGADTGFDFSAAAELLEAEHKATTTSDVSAQETPENNRPGQQR